MSGRADNSAMNRIQWLMLLSLSLLWGGSFFFVGIAVKELPTLTLVFLRVAGAAILLHLVLLSTSNRIPMSGKVWLAFFGIGLLNNVIPFSLIVWGQSHIASGLAAILNATTPMTTAIVAHIFTSDEKLTPRRLAGVLVGFAGVAVMLGPELLGDFTTSLMAKIAILLAALSYGFSGVFGRRFKHMGVSPIQTAAGQLTASSIMILPLAFAIDHPLSLPLPSLQVWFAVAGFIVLSTALAYIIFFRILATAGANNLSLVTFLIPVSAILLGILFLGETLEIKQLGGMALIGVGLAIIDGRLLHIFSRRNRAAA